MIRLFQFIAMLLLFQIGSQAEPQYPARPLINSVTLTAESMSIRDVLGHILKNSGLDWFLDGDIRGTATLKLTKIPWDKALEVVLSSQNLYSRRVGNLVTIFATPTDAESPDSIPVSPIASAPPQVEILPVAPPVDFQLLGIVGHGDSRVGILNIKGVSKMVRLGEALFDGSRITRLEEAGIELLGADGKSRVFTF